MYDNRQDSSPCRYQFNMLWPELMQRTVFRPFCKGRHFLSFCYAFCFHILLLTMKKMPFICQAGRISSFSGTGWKDRHAASPPLSCGVLRLPSTP